jgi:hypothetical protein
MFQFFIGSVGGLSGTASATSSTSTPTLVVDRPLAGTVDAIASHSASLKNVPALGGIVTAVATVQDAELITPIDTSGEDDRRRRVVSTDVWEFRKRIVEQLH